jgi:hypothetical protein
MSAREFTIQAAVRREIPVLIGLVAPSSAGKTFSALRLATGIQRVWGGEIAVVDTESRRALHYADRFKFQHIPFDPPFSSLDYLAAIRFAARHAKTVIVDSGSHEHEGPGGLLEWHERETERLSRLWNVKPEKAQMAAWGPPKRARREMINEILRMNVNLIFTFRAKEKIKMVRGQEPVDLGWQAIAGEEFMYEMTLQALLLPGAKGKPTWSPTLETERASVKIPAQFEELFDPKSPKVLDEDAGEAIARWGAGGVSQDPREQLVADYAKCITEAEYDALEKRRGEIWPKTKGEFKQRLKDASDAAKRRLAPPVDPADLIVSFREAGTLEDLERMFAAVSREMALIPIEIHAAYTDRKAALEQQERGR